MRPARDAGASRGERAGETMAWLESFLAFALTMLVFSTVVTIIIEGIHRVWKMREAGLKLLMESLFDKVVWGRFKPYFVKPDATEAQAAQAKAAARDDFVKLLTDTQGIPEKARGFFGGFVPKQITSLTSMQFAERLAQTEIGKKVVTEVQAALTGTAQELQQALDQVIKDLVQKFERFGAEATEFFKRRSHIFAVLLGFALVFAANFDAIQVFKAYLNDDKLREALIQSTDAIQKQHVAAVERLQRTADDKNAPAAVAADDLIKQLEKSRAEAEKALAELRAKGVPIGWSYFPRCAPLPAALPPAANTPRYADSRCAALHAAWLAQTEKACRDAFAITEEQAGKDDRYEFCVDTALKDRLSEALGLERVWKERPWQVAYWAFAVLLAGALVGLGGPFWYDTVRSLSGVLQLLRPSAPAPKPEPGVTFRGARGPADTRQPENPVEAFKTAAIARTLVEATKSVQKP